MKTPITILTGFLGSGKSTLLSQILKEPDFANTAVIVNEFGEVGLDDFLVTHSEEQVMEMTTGCLCCTIRGDISNTLMDLYAKRKTGELPNFDRIIVETTGLADPAPVIHAIMKDPGIFARFHLSGVVTTIDATNALNTLDLQEECLKQVGVADRIVITKTDLNIEPSQYAQLHNRLERLNPTAEFFYKNQADFDLKKLFETILFDEKAKGADVRTWLNLDKATEIHHSHHGHDHHHHHDVNKHGEHIKTFNMIFDTPLSSHKFIPALQSLINVHGEGLLRVKGMINLIERPKKPYVIHGVQHYFHEPVELTHWPSDDHRSKIVFITRNLDQHVIERYFKDLT